MIDDTSQVSFYLHYCFLSVCQYQQVVLILLTRKCNLFYRCNQIYFYLISNLCQYANFLGEICYMYVVALLLSTANSRSIFFFPLWRVLAPKYIPCYKYFKFTKFYNIFITGGIISLNKFYCIMFLVLNMVLQYDFHLECFYTTFPVVLVRDVVNVWAMIEIIFNSLEFMNMSSISMIKQHWLGFITD